MGVERRQTGREGGNRPVCFRLIACQPRPFRPILLLVVPLVAPHGLIPSSLWQGRSTLAPLSDIWARSPFDTGASCAL